MKRSTGARRQGTNIRLCPLLLERCWVAENMLNSLTEEESCLSVTSSSYASSSGSEDSIADKETSVKENAVHVYSELTAIRDKLHVSYIIHVHIHKRNSFVCRTSYRGLRSGRPNLLNARKLYWNWSNLHGQPMRD